MLLFNICLLAENIGLCVILFVISERKTGVSKTGHLNGCNGKEGVRETFDKEVIKRKHEN